MPAPICRRRVVVVISNRSRSSARPIDSPSGVAMKPVAIPPAVAASDARSPVPSSLIGRLKTISARMSDSSSGGVLDSASSGVRACRDSHARLDAGVRNLARRRDVEHRIELGVAGETHRAVARDVELPALELIRAAHGVHDPRERHRPARSLADVEVAADRDVDVADRRARRPAGPQLPSAQDEVVRNPDVHVQRDALEDLAGGAAAAPSAAASPARSRRLSQRVPAPGASPPRRRRQLSAVRSADTTSRQRLDAVRVVEQLQDAVDLEAARRRCARHLLACGRVSSPVTLSARPTPTSPSSLSMISKFSRLERDVDGADLSLVHRELAGDRQLLAVLVENLETPDTDDVGLEIDARVETRVRRPEPRHGERAVLDVDESLEVRIAAGPGDADVGLQRAADLVTAVVNP